LVSLLVVVFVFVLGRKLTYKAIGMADGGYLLVFRAMPNDQLLAMQQKYLDQMLNLGSYTSQTIGAKSYSRDLRELRSILEAIQFVLNERSMGDYEGTILTDFSEGGLLQGEPAGTTDPL